MLYLHHRRGYARQPASTFSRSVMAFGRVVASDPPIFRRVMGRTMELLRVSQQYNIGLGKGKPA